MTDFISHTLTLELVDELHLPLVNRFYAENGYKVKCGRRDSVYTIVVNGKIIAAARLILQESDNWLLRNLCVASEFRRQGVASDFLKKIVFQLAPKNCYCFTSTPLQYFYETVGFVNLTAGQVPADIGIVYTRYRERKRGWILMGFINRDYK